MKLKVKRLEDRAIVPAYQSKGASGFDLHSIDSVSVPSGKRMKIRTGLSFDIPEGYELQIRPRSGLSANSDLRIANAPGTIDSDYTGEVVILVDNISNNQADAFRVNEGDRIAQAVLVPVIQADIQEVGNIEKETERGSQGFGSTGE